MKKIYNWKKIKKFGSRTTIYLSLGLHKGRPSDKISLQLSKENIRHVKTWNFLIFFYFCGLFLPFWIRIRIPNTDPDPLTWMNPDPQPCLKPRTILRKSVSKRHVKNEISIPRILRCTRCRCPLLSRPPRYWRWCGHKRRATPIITAPTRTTRAWSGCPWARTSTMRPFRKGAASNFSRQCVCRVSRSELRILNVYPGSEFFFHPGSRVKKIPGSASVSKNLSILTQKLFLSSRK